MSGSVRPASFRQYRIACAGNPAAYLTRLNRSSSTAAISWPSQAIAAEAFAWYALIPKIFIAQWVSVPQLDSSRGEVSTAPLIQDIQRPRAGPCGLPCKKVVPNTWHPARPQEGRQRRRGLGETRIQLHAQRPTQPFLPRQRERTFPLRENLRRQQVPERLNKQGFLCARPPPRRVRQGPHKFNQRRIQQRHANFERLRHADRICI